MRTIKKRVDDLEERQKPKGRQYKIGHFNTRDYDNQSELDKDIEKWEVDNPLEDGEQYRIIVHGAGFKGWVWDYWEREFISPAEFERRKQKMYSRYAEDYGREATMWPSDYIEGESREGAEKE